jgi:CRP-like cAMP-binding protein
MGQETFASKTFDIGCHLFREDEPGKEAYLVKEGQVKITKTGADGEQKTLATVGQGGIVGEMALIDNEPRAATATALCETKVVVITNQDLQARLAKTDPVVLRLLNVFTQRLREQGRIFTKITSSPLLNK